MSDLVSKVRKWRSVSGDISHQSIANVQEFLSNAMKFLNDHETPSVADTTHTVFDSYQDWWTTNVSKATYKLSICEDNTLDMLWRYISGLYDLGIPLTLAERRTKELRLVQDLEIWGTQEETIKPEELIGQGSQFMALLGKIMGEIYPKREGEEGEGFLDLVIFDATGKSATKDVMKTSMRLVWTSIVVDKDRGTRICDYVVHKFKESADEEIKALERKMQELSKDNTWDKVFSEDIYLRREGIRMPLCDRVSPAPMKVPENRPFKAMGVTRFNYRDKELLNVEQVCNGNELEGIHWLKIGCLRRETGTPLTEWVAPQISASAVRARVRGTNAAGTVSGGSTGGGGGGMASRMPGQVRIRTLGGSGNNYSRPQRDRRPGQPQGPQVEQLAAVEREFNGTVDEFVQKLNEAMGSHQGGQIETQGNHVVWKQEGGGDTGRIEFKEANKRVYIIGKPHQIRSLVSVVAPFAQYVGHSAKSVVGSVRTSASKAGSDAAGTASRAGYAPSAVYAPSKAYSASALSTTGSTSGQSRVNQKRVAINDFDAQGASELALKKGDQVTVTHDPAEDGTNMHRWVFGQNETNGTRGWFPLSDTTAVEDSTPTETDQADFN